MNDAVMVGVDWGTSRRRAWLLGRSGDIIDTRGDDRGIGEVAAPDFPVELSMLVCDWPSVPVVMAGMVGSQRGWQEAPYVGCPAGLPDIAAGMRSVPDRGGTFILPGLSAAQDDHRDVLRGEEVQIFGAADNHGASSLVILPGTHSKWARVVADRVETFHTFPTGELFSAILNHTVLGDLAAGPQVTACGFERGLSDVEGGAPLLGRLFQARAAILLGALPPEDGAGFLSGLLIGTEVREGCDLFSSHSTCSVVGAERIAELYQTALKRAGVTAALIAEDVAARGLWRVASAAGLVG